MTTREMVTRLMGECVEDAYQVAAPRVGRRLGSRDADPPELIVVATLAAALFRARWVLEIEDEQLRREFRPEVIADAIGRGEGET